jgi:serine/threonine protein kinase
VDFYSLGAILHEMIYGYPPFYTTNTNQMFKEIVNKSLSFPP